MVANMLERARNRPTNGVSLFNMGEPLTLHDMSGSKQA